MKYWGRGEGIKSGNSQEKVTVGVKLRYRECISNTNTKNKWYKTLSLVPLPWNLDIL